MQRRDWLGWGLSAAAGLGGVTWAHAETGVNDNSILLGQNLALQGGKNAYGVAAAGGMKLYVDRINAAGGVHGRKLVLRVLDDDNKSELAEANARQLVKDGVFILFGSIDGGPSTAVMKVANELKVPFFGPLAGSPTLRTPHQSLVFPVRAEHKDEFRALLAWGKSTGLKTVGFFRSDTTVGEQHLANVQRLSQEQSLQVVLDLPFKGDITDAQIADWVRTIRERKVDMMFNHGSAGLYQRLVTQAKTAGLHTTFMGVNSGSSQIAKGLGALGKGMVFSQVVPSPWARKKAIAREYQDATRQADPKAEFSYGGMEGYLTAKALVMSLQAAGRELSRERWLRTLAHARFDLGGVTVRYQDSDHEGSRYVDLSMVDREGNFIQ